MSGGKKLGVELKINIVERCRVIICGMVYLSDSGGISPEGIAKVEHYLIYVGFVILIEKDIEAWCFVRWQFFNGLHFLVGEWL